MEAARQPPIRQQKKRRLKVEDLPTTWKEYWSSWCDKVQPDYRKKTGKRVPLHVPQWIAGARTPLKFGRCMIN